jgi:hypothetical protein
MMSPLIVTLPFQIPSRLRFADLCGTSSATALIAGALDLIKQSETLGLEFRSFDDARH